MRWAVPWCLVVIISVGCGAELNKSASPGKVDRSAGRNQAASPESAAGDNAKSAQPPSANALQRKIIYTATVNLVVELFDPVPAQVGALVDRFGAYVARSQITGSPGSPRRGQWTLRVPADHYEAFLVAAREVGEVQNVSSDSQDVTEEYYDVEARIRNKKQEETRLLELLSKATGKLEEVLAVEREIARVRGEVEQMEGRLRVLSNLTTMSTVNLEVREIKGYVPEEAVTYVTRVRRAWEGSTVALASTVQTLSILFVALLPWIGILLVPVLMIVFGLRMRSARKRG
ncbi:MAG: DUF4349 domain-containing protein [Planctomycetota bacterium]